MKIDTTFFLEVEDEAQGTVSLTLSTATAAELVKSLDEALGTPPVEKL